MPALITSSYTSYETLVFFQSVAQHGSDKSSLQKISTTLNENSLIRDSVEYDATKLAPDALQLLYTQTINQQDGDGSSTTNGHVLPNGVASSKNTPASSTPSSGKRDHERFIHDFADKLYAQFKLKTVHELRQQEKQYEDLQREITRLEDLSEHEGSVKEHVQPQIAQQNESQPILTRAETSNPAKLQPSVEPKENNVQTVQVQAHAQPPSQSAHLQPVPLPFDRTHLSPAPTQRVSTPKSASGTPIPHPAQPLLAQHHSPSTFNRQLPPPSPQRSGHGQLPPPPHTYPHHLQGQPQPPMLPPLQSLQRLPSHDGYTPHSRPSSQGRGSPMPQNQPSPYPPYPQYQPVPVPHGWHGPPPQQYLQQPYQPSPQFVPQPGRYPPHQTPHQMPYQPYPNTAPIPYSSQQQWRPPHVSHYHQYPASASVTPVPRRQTQSPMFRSGGSTPWKSKVTPIGLRARSPPRLDREVSPLSDHEKSPPASPKRQSSTPLKRARSHTSPGMPNDRSPSVTSNTSEAPDPPKRRVGRPPKIKPEPPTTPVPTVSDSEHAPKSSGKRIRQHTSTNVGSTNLDLPRTATTSSRRDAPSSSPAPRARSASNVQPLQNPKDLASQVDTDFVVVSKTFGKTSQLLLSEITSHKLAGIFAKPLSERDAPGYKSIVHRPQDLKSIKAAVNKGSRAGIAAIEEFESRMTTDLAHTSGISTPSRSPTTQVLPMPALQTSNVEGPIGNGFYLIRATEDLLPPRGIVNSSQLETELVRMFANAVIFNPLPPSERGFGRSLRLRKRGGTLLPDGARRKRVDDLEESADAGITPRGESEPVTVVTSVSDSSATDSSVEEGGIISDAREMFEDVERSVSRWRDLEGEKITGFGSYPHHQGSFSERHASVSASSAAEDAADGEYGTPSALIGSMRKRRKIGDH